MLMSLGLFIFKLQDTAAIDSYSRSDGERFASNNRHQQRASYQHLGPGEDTITLNCLLYPEITGDVVTLDILREMKKTGKSWLLITGAGRILGQYFIETITDKHSYLTPEGKSRKVEFSLTLKRTDDSRIDTLGSLATQVTQNLLGL